MKEELASADAAAERRKNVDIPVWMNDGSKVLYRGRALRGADAKTFRVILGNYACDDISVFFHTIKSSKIDRKTFKVLNSNFCVDSKNAYFVVTPIKGADPKSFRVLDSSLEADSSGNFLQAGYAADNKSVWFASGAGIFRVKNADPASFVSLGNRFGYDCERVYFQHAMLPSADRVSWRHWRGNLSIDKVSVFFTNKKVSTVDRASVKLLVADDCFMDRNQIYVGITPVSVERYLEFLAFKESACANDRTSLQNGTAFECVLNEHPHEI